MTLGAVDFDRIGYPNKNAMQRILPEQQKAYFEMNEESHWISSSQRLIVFFLNMKFKFCSYSDLDHSVTLPFADTIQNKERV